MSTLTAAIQQVLVPLRVGVVLHSTMKHSPVSLHGAVWYHLREPEEDKHSHSGQCMQTTQALQLIPFTWNGTLSTDFQRRHDGKFIEAEVLEDLHIKWQREAKAISDTVDEFSCMRTLATQVQADGLTDGSLILLFNPDTGTVPYV